MATDGVFAGLRSRRRAAPRSVYLRLALPAAFAGQYRRLLYYDSDIFVQSGDLAALLGIDLGGNALGGGAGQHPVANAGAAARAVPPGRAIRRALLQRGVLLIDVDAFNGQDMIGALPRLRAGGMGSR